MAKKKTTKKRGKQAELYWHYIVPSVVGGAIVWFITGSIEFAVIVSIVVLIGNYAGSMLMSMK